MEANGGSERVRRIAIRMASFCSEHEQMHHLLYLVLV